MKLSRNRRKKSIGKKSKGKKSKKMSRRFGVHITQEDDDEYANMQIIPRPMTILQKLMLYNLPISSYTENLKKRKNPYVSKDHDRKLRRIIKYSE
jgi:hypothetical protein